MLHHPVGEEVGGKKGKGEERRGRKEGREGRGKEERGEGRRGTVIPYAPTQNLELKKLQSHTCSLDASGYLTFAPLSLASFRGILPLAFSMSFSMGGIPCAREVHNIPGDQVN